MWRKILAGTATTITLTGGGVVATDQVINPYDDKGTHYELPIKADIPQGERVEIAKDKAAMTLKGWNDEYAITITPQIPTAQFGADKQVDRPFTVEADRGLLSKKMEFREGDVTAFIEPKEGTENEFDIDFTLDSKPDTNVFTYKIEGADEFDFFYQPAYDQLPIPPEDLQAGVVLQTPNGGYDQHGNLIAYIPPSVIGSYAVYHKTNANHRVGETNYATGKVFHIYRPKATDANGEEIWGLLSYTNAVLTITIPLDWLQTATYPVRIDPTFGYNTIGGGLTASFANNGAVGSYLNSTASLSGNVDTISVYASAVSGSVNVKGFMVNSSDVILTNGVSPAGTINTTPAWTDMTYVSKPAVTSGSVYRPWVVFNGNINAYRDTGGASGDSKFDNGNNYTTPNNPAVTNSSSKYSVYATYTASGGGGGTPGEEYTIIFQ